MGKNQSASNLVNIIQYNNGNISFVSGSTTLMQISASGAITTTGVISGSNALSASYAATASFVTLAQTASFVTTAQTASFVANAQSASNAVAAQTASYADALTVAGTLTAQTLVVQTITSSVDFVTGSTRFGTLLSNTHVFSGSVTMNPGGLFVSSSGRIGIGNTNPTETLFLQDPNRNPTIGITHAGGGSYFMKFQQFSGWNQLMTFTSAASYMGINTSGPLILNESGSNVGIGTTNPSAKLDVSGSVVVSGSLSIYGDGAFINRLSSGEPYIFFRKNGVNRGSIYGVDGGGLRIFDNNDVQVLTITSSFVGIGTTTPLATLQVRGPNAVGTFFDAQNDGAAGATFSRINASSSPYNQYTFANGNVNVGNSTTSAYGLLGSSNLSTNMGITFHNSSGYSKVGGIISVQESGGSHALQLWNRSGGNEQPCVHITSGNQFGINLTNPLATLSTLGGAVQFMGDYRNHATIIKSAGANGTFNGSLVITIPQMSNANVDGYGGYSCEVYVAGYSGFYCHAWFGGYINGGIVASEATILRSNGGWSISQTSYGANNQGFKFTIDYPSSIVHPTARIIFNKGGSPNSTAYPANEITATFS